MYVSLDVQVVVSDLSKVLSDNVTVQTADDERFTLYARQNSAASSCRAFRTTTTSITALRCKAT